MAKKDISNKAVLELTNNLTKKLAESQEKLSKSTEKATKAVESLNEAVSASNEKLEANIANTEKSIKLEKVDIELDKKEQDLRKKEIEGLKEVNKQEVQHNKTLTEEFKLRREATPATAKATTAITALKNAYGALNSINKVYNTTLFNNIKATQLMRTSMGVDAYKAVADVGKSTEEISKQINDTGSAYKNLLRSSAEVSLKYKGAFSYKEIAEDAENIAKALNIDIRDSNALYAVMNTAEAVRKNFILTGRTIEDQIKDTKYAAEAGGQSMNESNQDTLNAMELAQRSVEEVGRASGKTRQELSKTKIFLGKSMLEVLQAIRREHGFEKTSILDIEATWGKAAKAASGYGATIKESEEYATKLTKGLGGIQNPGGLSPKSYLGGMELFKDLKSNAKTKEEATDFLAEIFAGSKEQAAKDKLAEKNNPADVSDARKRAKIVAENTYGANYNPANAGLAFEALPAQAMQKYALQAVQGMQLGRIGEGGTTAPLQGAKVIAEMLGIHPTALELMYFMDTLKKATAAGKTYAEQLKEDTSKIGKGNAGEASTQKAIVMAAEGEVTSVKAENKLAAETYLSVGWQPEQITGVLGAVTSTALTAKSILDVIRMMKGGGGGGAVEAGAGATIANVVKSAAAPVFGAVAATAASIGVAATAGIVLGVPALIGGATLLVEKGIERKQDREAREERKRTDDEERQKAFVLNKQKTENEQFLAGYHGSVMTSKVIPEDAQTPKLKTGMDYVPYDNYLALLHEGEAVLNKKENEERRRQMMIPVMSGMNKTTSTPTSSYPTSTAVQNNSNIVVPNLTSQGKMTGVASVNGNKLVITVDNATDAITDLLAAAKNQF